MLLARQRTLEKSLMDHNQQKTMATVHPRLEYESFLSKDKLEEENIQE